MAELIKVWTQLKNDANTISLRRRLVMTLPFTTLLLAACSQSTASDAANAPNTTAVDGAGLSDEDAELKYRFRSIYGGQRRIDGLVQMKNVALHRENGDYFENGSFSPSRVSTSSLGGKAFIVPKAVRMMWFSDESIGKRAGSPPPHMKAAQSARTSPLLWLHAFQLKCLTRPVKKAQGFA